MNRLLVILLCVICTTAVDAATVALEQAVETSSAVVRVPNSVPSTLLAKACAGCRERALRIDASTQFFVNDEAVTLAEFLEFIARGERAMGIFYRRETSVVTRLVTFGN